MRIQARCYGRRSLACRLGTACCLHLTSSNDVPIQRILDNRMRFIPTVYRTENVVRHASFPLLLYMYNRKAGGAHKAARCGLLQRHLHLHRLLSPRPRRPCGERDRCTSRLRELRPSIFMITVPEPVFPTEPATKTKPLESTATR